MNKRRSGILLHISSLPGGDGIGTMGKEAFGFVDFLCETQQSVWQILPLGQTGFGNSPYSSFSAFGGNILFIDLQKLSEQFYCEFEPIEFEDPKHVDYEKVKAYKMPILNQAAENFLNNTTVDKTDYLQFNQQNEYWLNDFAFFMALKDFYENKPLLEFDEDIRLRKPEAMLKYQTNLGKEIETIKILQYFFFKQWFELKQYANDNGISILGDIPLYVAGDSADVWANSELFSLDENLSPVLVAGVPPDYFSETGQLWGNPIYKWDILKETGFGWWTDRIAMNLKLYDILRIDHFRGLSEFWAVPFGEETAVNGTWMPGPGYDLFDAIFNKLGEANIIAEDLGFITKDVKELRDKCNFPGMRILQFAFESNDQNDFLPHRYDRHTVVYTGTHDNDTILGWFEKLNPEGKAFFNKYVKLDETNIGQSMTKYAWSTVANLAITQMQDILNLNSDTRMNIPGTCEGDWEWRLLYDDIQPEHKEFLTDITELYERNLRQIEEKCQNSLTQDPTEKPKW